MASLSFIKKHSTITAIVGAIVIIIAVLAARAASQKQGANTTAGFQTFGTTA